MRIGLLAAIAATVAFSAAVVVVWPHARDAGALLLAQDDSVRLSDLQVMATLRDDPGVLARQAEEALVTGDSGLASSFLDLATAHDVALPDDLVTRVNAAVAHDSSASQLASRFATGLVTGEADDVASLSGTVAGDLFVFGDIRDLLREGKRFAMGEETDHVILALATAGLAITAATYVSIGGVAPVRAGLTLVKDARKVGRLGEGLAGWAGRSARGVIDGPALQTAVTSASVARPGAAMAGIKAAFRSDKAGGLLRLARNVGRVGDKAGTRGALDTLRIAQGPKDVARAAKLAEARGSQTRAILKMFGRGALLLAAGAFNLAMWVFWVLLAVLGVLASIKATTERLTLWWLRRARSRKTAARAQRASASRTGGIGVWRLEVRNVLSRPSL